MRCPVCSSKKFKSETYSEEYWGVVEEHSFCPQCGYRHEMSYSRPVCGFVFPTNRGWKDHTGRYHVKNSRKFKRIRRKMNIRITGSFFERFGLSYII